MTASPSRRTPRAESIRGTFSTYAIRYFPLQTKRNYVRFALSVTAFHFFVFYVFFVVKNSSAAETAAIQRVRRTFRVL